MSVLTLADAKTHLNIGASTSNDAELQTIIDAAEAAITQRVGPLEATATTSRVEGCGRTLILPVTPVISLTSVTPVGGSALTLSDLYLYVERGTVEWATPGGWFVASRYTVVYQAGRAALPKDLLLAIKELVRHLWDPQRGGGSARFGSPPEDMLSNTLSDALVTFPINVEQLLLPHQVPDF